MHTETAALNTPVRKEANLCWAPMCASPLAHVGPLDHRRDSLSVRTMGPEGLNNMPDATQHHRLHKEGGIQPWPGKMAVVSTNSMLAWEPLRTGPTHGQRAYYEQIQGG